MFKITINHNLLLVLLIVTPIFLNGQGVGIGTTTPKSTLDVVGNAAIGIGYAGIISAPNDGLIVKGTVGIGTSVPGIAKVNIFDDATGVGLYIGNGVPFGSAKIELDGPASTHFWVAESGTRVFSVTAGGVGYFLGKVGIGVTSPQSMLDIEGGVAIGASYSGSNASPINGMIVQGNVGIGTNLPNAQLEIAGTGELRLTESSPQIKFHDSNAGAWRYWIHNNGDRLYFFNDGGLGGAWTTSRPLTIYNDFIGIGDATPTAQLDVSGTIRFRSGSSNNFVLTGDASGNATWQDPNVLVDDITSITPGAGLAGSAALGPGAITLSAAANNGLNVDAGADAIQLGGSLIENTSLTQGAFSYTHVNNGSSNYILNLSSTGDFHIQDNGNPGLTVLDNGNVGIGISSPTFKTEIIGVDFILRRTITGTSIHLRTDGTNSHIGNMNDFVSNGSTGNGQFVITGQTGIRLNYGNVGSSGTTAVIIDNNGNMGVGTGITPPSYKLEVCGTIGTTAASVTTGIACSSDLRLKKGIKTLNGTLAKVLKLRGVAFDWRVEEFPTKGFGDSRQIGFIAQEIEELYPELVITNPDGYKAIDYGKMTPILLEAIKELKAEIDSLNGQVTNISKDLSVK